MDERGDSTVISQEHGASTGALVSLMKASSSKIKLERANQVLNNVHVTFKQKVDASFNKIGELQAAKADLLHKLVPTTTIQTDYNVNAVDFVDQTTELTKKLANEKMWFTALKEEYCNLFGKEYVEPESFL